MADEIKQEYNPIVLGFSNKEGPIHIPLNQARETYGRLPSSYGFVPLKKGRQKKRGLNLDLGKFICEIFKAEPHNFKKDVFDFFYTWHRDYESEFGFKVAPFLNMNDPVVLEELILENRALFESILSLDLKGFLIENRLVRKDILHSIQEDDFSQILQKIMEKKLKVLEPGPKKNKAQQTLNHLFAVRILNAVETMIGSSLVSPDKRCLAVHADEIARMLLMLGPYVAVTGLSRLRGVRGTGVEFEFAPRDASYLMLGKNTGDCTADKRNFQADRTTENIFWTVFSWILDQNYQILKVYFDGEFVMKAHLLPLYINAPMNLGSTGSLFTPRKTDYMVLAVDAMETIRGFRDDLPAFQKPHLLEKKEFIFKRTMDQILDLAGKMGIENVVAEKFSNTGWVRRFYDRCPEMFLHVDHIQKIDQLEDVFFLARNLFENRGASLPEELFMEIQMKNIYLSPESNSRAPGVKSFAVIRGDSDQGIPMNKVVGI